MSKRVTTKNQRIKNNFFYLKVINIEESMAVLTRCSFDESHRQPIFLLGGIPALAELIQVGFVLFEAFKQNQILKMYVSFLRYLFKQQLNLNIFLL